MLSISLHEGRRWSARCVSQPPVRAGGTSPKALLDADQESTDTLRPLPGNEYFWARVCI
jgi:hypothetical protein